MIKLRKTVAAAMILFALFVTAGCDQESAPGGVQAELPAGAKAQGAQEGGQAQKPPQDEDVKVYFANEDGTKLIAKSKPKAAQDKFRAAVNALIAGTGDKGAVSMIPKGTKLRDIKVEQGVAYVDFSQDLVKKFNGGSTGEIMLVASIVNTLTEFPEVKAVQILIEGKKVETISGHMDTSEPFKRKQFEDILKN